MKKVYEDSEVGRVVARYEAERERDAKQNELVREALASLKSERDAISAEKFETERKLLELEGEYRRLQKKVGGE